MNNGKKDYCVKAAFRRLLEVSMRLESHKRQSASPSTSPCNCEFCKRNRRELEYEKTVRLLNLMKGAR